MWGKRVCEESVMRVCVESVMRVCEERGVLTGCVRSVCVREDV